MKLFILGFLLFIASVSQAAFKSYHDYQVFEVRPRDRDSFDALVQLQLHNPEYDFWTDPRCIDRPVDIMVPPELKEGFLRLLEAFDMEYRLKIANVQTVIDAGRKDIAVHHLSARSSGDAGSPRYSLDWTSYSDYPAIVDFIKEIEANNPSLVTLINIGKSYEGNDMYVVKISSSIGPSNKKAIFADAGIHAREWIAPAFATWLIHELVENYRSHPEYVDQVDWYIVPVLNPDGYRYTFSGNRLWRKNRAPTGGQCIGTDLNRNYDFHWNEGGSSNITCSEVYHGEAPFDQPESRNVGDFILTIADRTRIYLALHSYGQYFLTPWGYTPDLPEDYDQLKELALRAIEKLATVNGTVYEFGSSDVELTVTSGSSDDWAKGAAGIPYSYTIEMRDTGTFGFLLPANQIIPNNLELWEAVKVLAESLFPMHTGTPHSAQAVRWKTLPSPRP